MDRINLQKKTKSQIGKIEMYWFENESIGLAKTLFHKFTIPLEPFNSGLDYVAQPEKTEVVIDWVHLNVKDPTQLNGLNLKTSADIETSIYLGSAHNPCDIISLTLTGVTDNIFVIDCKLFVDFEHEGVGQNEEFVFSTQLQLDLDVKEY